MDARSPNESFATFPNMLEARMSAKFVNFTDLAVCFEFRRHLILESDHFLDILVSNVGFQAFHNLHVL